MSDTTIRFAAHDVQDFSQKVKTLANLDTRPVIGDDLTPKLTTVSKIRAFFLKIAQMLGFNVTVKNPKDVVDNLNEFFERNFSLLLTLDRTTLTKIESVVQKLQKQYSPYSYTGNNGAHLSEQLLLGEECLAGPLINLEHLKILQYFPTTGNSPSRVGELRKIIDAHPELRNSNINLRYMGTEVAKNLDSVKD